MTGKVIYSVESCVATIAMDDGKVNALSPDMQCDINEALDHAELEGIDAVVIAGNSRVFSGGFDLGVLTTGSQQALEMLIGGFELAVRLLAYPKPVVMACTGPAIAMGSFLLLSGDHRVGAAHYRIQANEVAIGMTLPSAAIEIMRLRLTPAAFQRAVTLAATFSGEAAVSAGWLDELAQPDAVLARAQEVALDATQLHAAAHRASKLRARAGGLDAIRVGIDSVESEFSLPR
jgi:enoyl-CoA hydratase